MKNIKNFSGPFTSTTLHKINIEIDSLFDSCEKEPELSAILILVEGKDKSVTEHWSVPILNPESIASISLYKIKQIPLID